MRSPRIDRAQQQPARSGLGIAIRFVSYQAGDNRSASRGGFGVELRQVAEVVHDPFLVFFLCVELPAGVNLKLGHARGVETGGCIGLGFWAAQGLADSGYLLDGEVTRGAVAGE